MAVEAEEDKIKRSHGLDIVGYPGSYIQDGLATAHNHEFMDSPDFRAAYQRGVAASGRDYAWHWRVHIGLWAAKVASSLPGDFVECGVNAGFMSSSIMQALDWDSRGSTFYLLDTFSGIDERYVSDAERAEGILEKNQTLIDAGFYVIDMAPVERNFAQWKNTKIVKGSIPETLTQIDSERVAFIHIDLNCAPPEVAALKYLWNRLSPGGVVLLDDYGYTGYREQKLAMDALAAELGFVIASLPTGQGLIIKPHDA